MITANFTPAAAIRFQIALSLKIATNQIVEIQEWSNVFWVRYQGGCRFVSKSLVHFYIALRDGFQNMEIKNAKKEGGKLTAESTTSALDKRVDYLIQYANSVWTLTWKRFMKEPITVSGSEFHQTFCALIDAAEAA